MDHTPEADVLIIGGGIAGVSTAFRLANLGRRVTLLERGEIAGEASGVNAGGLGGTGWGNIPDLQAFLTMGSLEIFKSLQLDSGYDFELRVAGALQAVHNAEQWDHVRGRVVTLRSQGHNVELLTTRAGRAIEPEASDSLAGFDLSSISPWGWSR